MNRMLTLCVVLLSALATADAATTGSIAQYGITWTFDQPVEYGQFANGDYWVVGPVTITSISPLSTDIGGRTKNGSMINPSDSRMMQGFDSAMYGSNPAYSAAMNVALDVSVANPLVVATGSSLLSTISRADAGLRPQLATMAVLTVLDSPAPAGSFRPPYFGTDKSIRFNEGDLDFDKLPRLAVPESAPGIANLNFLTKVWPDWWETDMGRFVHPLNNMPDYGREIALRIGDAALSLTLDYTDAEKEMPLIRMTQLGLDLYALFESGQTWLDLGGHMHGRKLPILMAGLVLDDPDMLAVGQARLRFQEDRQTWIVTQADVGRPLYHDDGRPRVEYIQEDVGIPEWGEQHTKQPVRDGRNWGAYYRRIVGHSILPQVLAAHILHLRDEWNWEPLFLYADRFWSIERDFEGTDQIKDFHWDMWDLYRDSMANAAPTADAGPDQAVIDTDVSGSEDVTLDASGSVDPDGSIVDYTWRENGSPIATGVNPTASLAVGEHTIELTVTDSDNETGSDSVVVTVAYPGWIVVPVADAGPDQAVTDFDYDGDEDVVLNGAGSVDADGTVVSYVWEDSGVEIATGVAPTVTLTVGVHTIDLIVTDNDGAADTDTMTVTVKAPPSIEFDAATSASDGAGSRTLSWSHTLGAGSNRVLVVTLGARDGTVADLTVTGVTFDGVVMNAVPAASRIEGAGTRAKTDIFYMLEDALPAAGTYTVEVTYAGLVDKRSGASISLTGVAQQAPEATGRNGANATSISSSITTQTNGAWIVDVVCINTGSYSTWTVTGDDMVRRWNQCPAGHTAAGATTPVAAAGPVTLNWSFSGAANRIAHSMAAFARAELVAGDADSDGDVDLDDFVILKTNFGRIDASIGEGDFDGDGDVDLDDFVILKTNFGT